MSAAGVSAAAVSAAAFAAAAAAACGTVAVRGGRKTALSPGEAQPCSLLGSLVGLHSHVGHGSRKRRNRWPLQQNRCKRRNCWPFRQKRLQRQGRAFRQFTEVGGEEGGTRRQTHKCA